MKKTGLRNTAVFALIGLGAGLVNGFLGTGGGIVIILVLGALRKRMEKHEKKSPFGGSSKDDYIMAIASILPMSAVSLWSYWQNGSFDVSRAAVLLLPASAGGLLGAFLLNKISPKLLKRIFAGLMIISGVIMISRSF